MILLANYPVLRMSKLQGLIFLSVLESEYISLNTLMRDFGYDIACHTHFTVYGDNKGSYDNENSTFTKVVRFQIDVTLYIFMPIQLLRLSHCRCDIYNTVVCKIPRQQNVRILHSMIMCIQLYSSSISSFFKKNNLARSIKAFVLKQQQFYRSRSIEVFVAGALMPMLHHYSIGIASSFTASA